LEGFLNKFLLTGGMLLILFSSCARNTVTDADGNIYHTVKIGNQIWTAENLRTTKWSDGAPIPHVPDSIAWHNLDSPGYCYYANTNNADTIKRFGALYNWYCVDSKKLAPPGWHVPTNDDWDTLQNYLIKHGYNWDGEKWDNRIAKSLAAQSGWKPFGIEGMPGNNMKDNNRSGFTGYAAGYRYDSRETHPVSMYWGIGHRAAWWSATETNKSIANVYGLGFCVDNLLKYDQQWLKTCGYQVRLVKNKN
jgi:uncharacterized protein (TIGR02145 family)